MNYKKGLKIVKETTLSSGSTFGTAPGIGQHGGDVGNNDFYARGNALNLLGWGGAKKGKRKAKKRKFPLYRRAFTELIGIKEDIDTEGSDETPLDCLIQTKNSDYVNILKQILEKRKIHYIIEAQDALCFTETDEIIQGVIKQLTGIITEVPFEEGEIVALIGEMDVQFKEPKKPREEYDQEQLRIGIDIEKEHTNNEVAAAIIAMNHLDELPNYYKELPGFEDRLKKMKGVIVGRK